MTTYFRNDSPPIPDVMALARFSRVHCCACDRSLHCGCECDPCLLAVKSETLRARLNAYAV